ncbi:MAG TPA: nucleotidyltransferase family protein, partial [Thermoanaerobaculia bacterium]
LIRMASPHGMLPLLYWNLNNTCPAQVPKEFLDQLRKHFHANARHNLVLTAELLKLLRVFESHEIPVVPFKGPVLAASVYGNLALREFGDLDILVRRRDAMRAKDLLLSFGYRDPRSLSEAQETALRQSGCQYCLVRGDGRVGIDLHWRFTTASFPFPLGLEDLQDRLVPVDLAGTTVLSLAPDDLLLVLCMHGSKHLWTRLEWICGVAELVRATPKMKWEQVIEKARKVGGKRMFCIGLLLARDLLRAPLSDEVCANIESDSAARLIAGRVRKRLFREGGPGGMELWGFRCRVRERWRDRWPFLMSLAGTLITPNTEDQAFLQLPASLSFLHYLSRPIRLVGSHVIRPLGRSFSGKLRAKAG